MKRKTVLVTGSSIGLGSFIIKKFASNNYNVIINYSTNKDEAMKLKDEILNEYNIEVLIIKCDISNENDIENILDCCNLHYWNSDMDDSDDLFLNYEKKTNTKKDQGTSL